MSAFDVVIVMKDSGKVEAVIGTNLNELQAERREMTGLMQIDMSRAFVDTVPAGAVKKGDDYRAKVTL